MQPTEVAPRPLKTKKFPKQRHFLAVFFISFTWGTFGADRMYLGKWGTGVLKLITAGGFGLWTIIDLILVMSGSMRDKWGREMKDFTDYKSFAYKTVLIFAIALGVMTLISGLFLIAAVSQFFADPDGGVNQIMHMLQGTGLSPDQMTELGL